MKKTAQAPNKRGAGRTPRVGVGGSGNIALAPIPLSATTRSVTENEEDEKKKGESAAAYKENCRKALEAYNVQKGFVIRTESTSAIATRFGLANESTLRTLYSQQQKNVPTNTAMQFGKGNRSVFDQAQKEAIHEDLLQRGLGINSVLAGQRDTFIHEKRREFAQGENDLGSAVMGKAMTDLKPRTLSRFRGEFWEGTLKNCKTNDTRRTEALNDPYNALSVSAVIRACIGPAVLPKRGCDPVYNEGITGHSLFNIDGSSHFLNERGKKNTEVALAVGQRKLNNKNRLSNRATRPDGAGLCASRSLAYLPLISAIKLVSITFKIRDYCFPEEFNKIFALTSPDNSFYMYLSLAHPDVSDAHVTNKIMQLVYCIITCYYFNQS